MTTFILNVFVDCLSVPPIKLENDVSKDEATKSEWIDEETEEIIHWDEPEAPDDGKLSCFNLCY